MAPTKIKPSVHPDLAAHQNAMKPRIHTLKGHIHSALAYSVVNCTLIEGDDACILVDTMTSMETAELAAVSFASRELALEGLSQGAAFLLTMMRTWPHDALTARQELLSQAAIAPTLAIATAMACTAHGIEPNTTLHLYLQAWSANLINATVRLVPLGQTDGQLVQAALEGAVIATAQEAGAASLDDLGSAAMMVDWASMQHENQYTRLFRS